MRRLNGRFICTEAFRAPLYTAMVSDRDDTHYYRKETGAYWYNGDEKPNHDVVIIGWDDHYSRDNFNQPPEGMARLSAPTAGAANLRRWVFLRILL